MKNLAIAPLKNGPKRCKTSEVFCKPPNLKNPNIKEINSLQVTCGNRHHDLQMMCKTMKTQLQQALTMFYDHHCKHPCYYITGGGKHPLVSNAVTRARIFHRQGEAQ